MRRSKNGSPMPAGSGGTDVLQPAASAQAAAPAASIAPAAPPAAPRREAGAVPPGARAADAAAAVTGAGLTWQLTAALVTAAGLWVALSPWFLTLQVPARGSSTAADLIIGLAVAVAGTLAAARARGTAGLPAATLLAGTWIIISPFILAARLTITDSMYWSNIWSGAVIAVLSLAMLAAGLRRAAR